MPTPPEPPSVPKVTYLEREGYLEAVLPTTDTVERLHASLTEILQYCKTRKPARLLLDMTAASGKVTTLQRYDQGMIGAQLAPYVQRVAVWAQAAYIDPQKIGVVVARNRGLNVDIFDSREAALAWLMES